MKRKEILAKSGDRFRDQDGNVYKIDLVYWYRRRRSSIVYLMDGVRIVRTWQEFVDAVLTGKIVQL